MIGSILAFLGLAAAAPGPAGATPGRAVTPGTEFVLVIDNSCSMIEPHVDFGENRPAADPDRWSVLGALIVEGLTRGSNDELTLLTFPVRRGAEVLEVNGATGLRDLPPASGTFFVGPLLRAKQVLNQSTRQDRMLLFLSDGQPNDLTDPAIGRKMLGLPPAGEDTSQVPFDTLVLGLLPSPNPDAEGYLIPLAKEPADYVRVETGSTLVDHFTKGYARALGSKALTGTLSARTERSLEIGKYVDEVLVVTSGVGRSGAYSATLTNPAGELPPRASGDNGCSRPPAANPDHCRPPRIHYAVWRSTHDPAVSDRWKLTIGEAGGDVAWGVILRYDFDADVELPELGKVGAPTPIRARLLHGGAPVDDPAFFAADGFRAVAMVAGQQVELTHAGAGVWEGTWTPTAAAPATAEVVFQNAWMEERADSRMNIEQPPPLSIEAPPVLDFGAWRGERRRTTRCVPLTVTSNHAYDPSRLAFSFAVPDDVTLTVVPEGPVLQACLTARGCCGDLRAPDDASITITARDLEGSTASATMGVRYQVERTGFLRCWWPWLVAALILLIVLWFLYGWIRPNDFDEDLTIKVAGSERQLARAAALVLREQPKGRRGFYRNARVALTGTGDFVANPRNAAVWIEASGRGETRIHLRGPVEIRDRRTKKWERLTEEQAADGVRTQEIYRLGELYFRFQ